VLALLSVAIALPLLFATPAVAAPPGVSHAIGLYAQQHHAEIAQAVALLAGFVAAHVTAWLTHVDAPSSLKAKVAALATVVAAVVASIGWDPGQPWYSWVKAIGWALVGSQGTYLLREVTGVKITQQLGLALGRPKADTAVAAKAA
jgi:hypothetical protein